MGYTCQLMSNKTYSAQDINKIFSMLTTQGVSLFNYTQGDNPLIDINTAVANFTTPGVEFYNSDACKVTYNDTDDSFMILKGNAFMIDGSSISIDEEGYDITEEIKTIRKNSTNLIYVYFYRDVASNVVDICVTDDSSELESTAVVKLAEINSDGNIFDLRTFAKTKLAPCTSNIFETVNLGTFRISSKITTPGCLYATATCGIVFPTYVYAWNKLFDVQSINTTDGTELNYLHIDRPIGSFYAAFNYVNDELQLWAYSKSSYHDFTNFEVKLM